MIKLKLLTTSIKLYLLGRKITFCKHSLDCLQKTLPLTSSNLVKLSNKYQKLLKRWITAEKRALLLRAFVRLENNLNL